MVYVVLIIIGLLLTYLYFVSWNERLKGNFLAWLVIALLIALFLWLYGYGDLLRALVK